MKKQKEVKKRVEQTKAIFLILNIFIAIIAFSWIVNAQNPSSTDAVAVSFRDLDSQRAFGGGEVQLPSDLTQFTPNEPFSTIMEVKGTTGITETINFENIDAVFKDGTVYAERITLSDGQIVSRVQIDPKLAKELAEKGYSLENPSSTQTSQGLGGAVDELFGFLGKDIAKNFAVVGAMAFAGYLIGGLIGDNADIALASAMAAGTFTAQIFAGSYGTEKGLGLLSKYIANPISGKLGTGFLGNPIVLGVIVGAIVFTLMYKKTDTEIVEFSCYPYEPPIGGKYCEECGEDCSEYRCKSLGQACELLNQGSEDEKCAWVNPRDVKSPKISLIDVSEGHIYKPDNNLRPPATGVEITQENGNCIKAFTPLEFKIKADEPAQCKIDYNLTKGFDEMNYFLGGSNLFEYNHTEKLSLPGADTLNKISPELKNDGTYTLYIRCRDANGNYNQDAYSVRFCVEKGPDTTPPVIIDYNIASGSPVQYNTTKLNLEVYVNEPSDCKWSREDRDYELMENSMLCNNEIWEMNANLVYTCKTTLTGIQDRKENLYYIRCKDKPNFNESERNVNTQSEIYSIIGTQPLNILEIKPNKTISSSSNLVPVYLEVKTDNGYDNGESICYYSLTGNENDYIEFAENTNYHKQRQDLSPGDYKYYIKCVDLGGNTDYETTSFKVESDKQPPIIIRAYKENGLKIITNEKASCYYSLQNCNFNIEDGIAMNKNDNIHTTEWKDNLYYIRCKDEYNNQPNPNSCSIIVKPYDIEE